MVSAQIALLQQSLPCRMLGVGDAEGAAVLHSVLPNLFGMQRVGTGLSHVCASRVANPLVPEPMLC